ncbi:MAG: DNA polymerase I [Sandaracinaceae bacterium]
MATSLPPRGDADVLYVVDFSGYVYRAYHALPPMSTSGGEPTHAVFGVTRMLLKLIKEREPVLFAVALDPEGPSFRKELYAAYKATRSETPVDLIDQMKRLEEVLDAYAVPKLRADRFEADDLIATLVGQAREAGLRTVIVSADKDLLQLVADDVLLYDESRERVYGPAEAEEKLGVPPSKVRDYLALTGDSSDNVPGVPSVGPKTAARFLGTYASLEDLYANLDDLGKKAVRRKLEEHRDDAFLSRDLVTLRTDAPVTLDRDAFRYGGADDEQLRTLFGTLEFYQLIGELAPRVEEPASFSAIGDLEALRQAVDEVRRAGVLSLYTATEGDDPLTAHPVGLGVSWATGQGAYVPFAHRVLDGAAQLPQAEVLELVRPLLTDPDVELCLGDAKRELLLWGRLGVEPTSIRFDVMLASYLVDPERHNHSLEAVAETELQRSLEAYDAVTERRGRKRTPLDELPVERVGDWAAARAEIALAAEGILVPRLVGQGLLPLLANVEIPLARVLAGMEREGIAIDLEHLARLSTDAETRIAELEREAYRAAGQEFKISSPRALETLLFDELGLPVIKRTKTARSTDQEVLEELAAEHELPAIILAHRSLTKLKSTYLDALPKQVHPETGRIHTRFNQAVAATGRMSSSDPNLQNIPIRTDEGRAIRDAFVARQGWSLLSADYSQIELRVLAHLSGDPELVDAFRADEDVHVRTATALFDVEPAAVTREMRGQAKTVNYAEIYGQTQFALARNLGISRTEAKRYIDAFFARYAGVARFMEETVERARRSGGCRTLLGRWRTLPDIRSRNRGLRAGAERMARNTPIQGSAADLMKVAMVRIQEALDEGGFGSRMLLTVHDELVFGAAPGEEERLTAMVKHRMETVWELDVPLVVDAGLGRTWNEAH